MKLVNILLLLLIIYVGFLILDKFGGYILGLLLAILIAIFIPIVWGIIKSIFKWIGIIAMKPLEWMTGVQIVIPYWVIMIIFFSGLIFFVIPIRNESRMGDSL